MSKPLTDDQITALSALCDGTDSQNLTRQTVDRLVRAALTELVETRKERAIWENLPYPANRAVAMTKEIEELTAERDEWHRRHNVVAETYEAEVGRLRAALEQIDRVICTCGHVDPCPTHAAATDPEHYRRRR